jgi:hypothetical protein
MSIRPFSSCEVILPVDISWNCVGLGEMSGIECSKNLVGDETSKRSSATRTASYELRKNNEWSSVTFTRAHEGGKEC